MLQQQENQRVFCDAFRTGMFLSIGQDPNLRDLWTRDYMSTGAHPSACHPFWNMRRPSLRLDLWVPSMYPQTRRNSSIMTWTMRRWIRLLEQRTRLLPPFPTYRGFVLIPPLGSAVLEIQACIRPHIYTPPIAAPLHEPCGTPCLLGHTYGPFVDTQHSSGVLHIGRRGEGGGVPQVCALSDVLRTKSLFFLFSLSTL